MKKIGVMNINIEIGNNTVEMVNGLGLKLEEYGVELFQIMVNQQGVAVGHWIFMVFILLVSTIIGLKILNYKKDSFIGEDASITLLLFTIIIYLIVCLMFVIETASMIQWVLNPEYAAIKELRYLVR
jgi:hypothetical protein